VPLTGNAVYDLIIRRTKAHFGQAVHPHVFRDSAATLWAVETPAIIEGASALLGHSDPKTLRHYNQARSVAAGRRLAALLREREASC
jgi:integrase